MHCIYTQWMAQRTERGFKKILTGPAHPDYEAFCQGPGHGTGYQDQIIIEANDFIRAIHEEPKYLANLFRRHGSK